MGHTIEHIRAAMSLCLRMLLDEFEEGTLVPATLVRDLLAILEEEEGRVSCKECPGNKYNQFTHHKFLLTSDIVL